MLGFAVIMLIPIDIVRELGITASLGVAWMIVTNKMLLPILLSYITLSKQALAEGGVPGEPRRPHLARGRALRRAPARRGHHRASRP